LPRTSTSVLAVPRSIPMSRENMPMRLLKGLANVIRLAGLKPRRVYL
jgi:hypothetical protein